jgi:hypothetical protein
MGWGITDVEKRLRGLAGGVLAAVGFLSLVIAGAFGTHQYTVLKHWPAVEAVVTRNQVIYARPQPISQNSGSTLYQAEIEFH